jgi:hypothetical protein
MFTTMRLLAILSLGPLLTACPRAVEHPIGRAAPEALPVADDKDPRVARDGEDLYPAAVLERAADGPNEVSAARGSGKPDESNGTCRLYAPKLPDPHCCEVEYGFDSDAVKEACGLQTYLGESFQFTCGYHYHLPDGHQTWWRMSFVPGKTPKEAAATHDRKLRQTTRNPDFASVPVPGAPGAYWSTHQDLGWAFVPGWSKVRLLTWKSSACGSDGVATVIGQLIEAEEPPEGAPRLALIPRARSR